MFKYVIPVAGLVQLLIAATSLLIPKMLNWRDELKRLTPLTRSVFWTYAGYILVTHVLFAALSLFLVPELLSGTVLAAVVTAFIALWWLVRIVGQFAWYERTEAISRPLFRVAEVLYICGFGFVTVVFGAAAVHNITLALR